MCIRDRPLALDTTSINSYSDNRIYNILSSEDKHYIAVFKINSKNNDKYFLKTSLFDNDLKIDNRSRVTVDMPGKSDFLSEFTLGNDGSLVFLRAAGSSDN